MRRRVIGMCVVLCLLASQTWAQSLSAAQLQTLKTAIAADPTLSSKPPGPDGNYAIAAAMNLTAAPDFFVWATSVPVQAVYDAIAWANLTPADAADGTQTWANRALVCQGKQLNLQMLLQGQNTINGAKTNVRAGLQDALTNIPSGVSGAMQAANWVAVRTALARRATRAEKLFADTAIGNGGTAATAALMVFEGSVSADQVDAARALP